jgi:hypothetical protein
LTARPKKKTGGLLGSKEGDKLTPSELIRRADANGPGVVGYYLDMVADLASRFGYEVQLWNPATGSFEWWNNPIVTSQVSGKLIGPQGERSTEFIRAMARDVAGVGEVGFAPVDVDAGIRYRVLPVDPGSYHVVSKKDDGTPLRLAFPGYEGMGKPKERQDEASQPGFLFIDADKVWRVYRPHPRFWAQPYSPLMRVLQDLRRFENASRAFHRAVASQLINAKILAIRASQRDLGHVSSDGKPGLSPGLASQINNLLDGFEHSLLDYEEEWASSAAPHLWVSSEDTPLELVDLGPVVDEGLQLAKEDALKDIARGLNVPQESIVNGIGSATRLLNEDNLREGIEEAVRPLAALVANALTTAFLHPALRRLGPDLMLSEEGRSVAIEDVRIWPNQLSVTSDDPDIDDIFRAVEIGALEPQAITEALDQGHNAMQLPPGLTSFDWWQTFVSNRSARRAASSAPQLNGTRPRTRWHDEAPTSKP